MVAAARHDAILRELELRGSLRVAGLSERLRVSDMTLRRDLIELESRGLLVRVHGGAVSLAVSAQQSRSAADAAPRRPIATIGMIAPSATYYFPQVIRGASEAARELNCRLVLGTTNYSEREELRQAERLIAGGIDGLMITPHAGLAEGEPLLRLLKESPVPVVVMERDVDERLASRVESVRSDHAYGAELAVEHLHERGHRRIALAAREAPTVRGLRDGYERSMARLGLADDMLYRELPTPAVGADPTTDVLEEFLSECLRADITAALMLGDVDSMAFADLAAERGIRIPEDFALVAYDDEFSAFAAVPLTAVAPPKHDLGRIALKLCLDRIRNPSDAGRAVTRTSLLPTLIERESTRTS
ncbi:DNA-binding LacI/PurR family transcriptional regulator [Microbacterium sp. ZKA21]|jgi:DNA-binding LacI/PurR family transcriptional regulator|uniref:LacI family DNA-binding transcriptional regulator n=1 Tax=Microbacterium sp. ZKA21 TaxID=3381694 RepID=UPI003D211488